MAAIKLTIPAEYYGKILMGIIGLTKCICKSDLPNLFAKFIYQTYLQMLCVRLYASSSSSNENLKNLKNLQQIRRPKVFRHRPDHFIIW